MSKERTSLSLDPDVAQFLKQDHVNASGLVNKLVKQHMNGGAGEDIIREFRMNQLESELNQLQSQEEQKRKELEKLRELEREKKLELEEELTDARDAIEALPDDRAHPDNEAVKVQAEKVDMDPSELLRELGYEVDE